MEVDQTASVPDRIVDILREETSDRITVQKRPSSSTAIELSRSAHAMDLPTEVLRQVGVKIIEETGWAITGIRSYDDHTTLWFDELDRNDNPTENTVAQQAAEILRESKPLVSFEPHNSTNNDEQFVEVYTDPDRSASTDFSISRNLMEELNNADIEVCGMSLNLDDSFDADHRIWFQSRSD